MITNEISRFVLEFAIGPLCDGLRRSYSLFSSGCVFVAVEKTAAGHKHQLVLDRIEQPYSNVSRLCSTRCIQAERGNLLVNGKTIKPENYLKLWREAIARPLSLTDVLSMGIKPVVHIRNIKATKSESSSDATCTDWQIEIDSYAAYSVVDRLVAQRTYSEGEFCRIDLITEGQSLPQKSTDGELFV